MALRLTKGQRDEIKYLRDHQHYSWRNIGIAMGIDFTIAYKEYKRNRKRGGSYDPNLAQQKTYMRNHYKKKQCKTIRMCNELEDYILQYLEVGWSPELIAGRWNEIDKVILQQTCKKQLPTITGITIRRYIHSQFGYRIKEHLLQNKLLKQRKQKAKREKRTGGTLLHRIFIDMRPSSYSQPTTIGHFECDFIVSKKGDKTVFMVLIDKFSRYKIAIKLDSRDSMTVHEELMKLIRKYYIQSITFDNDNGFALHYKLGIPTYFCHTYSSREKGQVERGNRSYRIFFPKGTLLSEATQIELNEASILLNNIPMQCLKFRTPKEIWDQEIDLGQGKNIVVGETKPFGV